jgi:hypothetical protein
MDERFDELNAMVGVLIDAAAPSNSTSVSTATGQVEGNAEENPGLTCATILENANDAVTGTYWVTGAEGEAAHEVFCDMTTDGKR